MANIDNNSGKDAKDELVLIVESGRCSWAKCLFCSFSKKPDLPDADTERLKCDLNRRLARAYTTVKYLNSGSFLDTAQIPIEFQKYIIRRCRELGVKNLVVECRPEHITQPALDALKKENPDNLLKIHFALGLEIKDDNILEKICKGFKVKDYEHASEILKENGFLVRTYLMANLPYVDDIKKSLIDSIEFAKSKSDSVAVINTFPFGYAPLFHLWEKGTWKPLSRKDFESLTAGYNRDPKVELYYDDYVSYPHFGNPKKLIGANTENLKNSIYDVWQDYISRIYEHPKSKRYALFLPCAFRKPYSHSRTHKEILKRISSLPFYPALHQVMISNPGVIPREFETKYPFAHYDWPEWEETPQIKRIYTEVTAERIENYLKNHRYEKVFSYFKPTAESYDALKIACEKLGIKLISCTDETLFAELKDDKNPLTNRRLLDNLARALRKNIP